MEGMPPYEGPNPAVSEALRTMQDDRNHPESVASMAVSYTHLTLPTIYSV